MMRMNHVHAPIGVGRDLSGDQRDLILLEDIANGGEEAGFLRRANADMRLLAADVEHHIGGSPCLEHHRRRVRDRRRDY